MPTLVGSGGTERRHQNVGGSRQIVTVKDADGNAIGLLQDG